MRKREYDLLRCAHTCGTLSQESDCRPEAGELIALHLRGHLKHEGKWVLRGGKLTFISSYTITRKGTAAMLDYRQKEREGFEWPEVSR